MKMLASTPEPLQRMQARVAHLQSVALLGPEGTWTHQAALELWPDGGAQLDFMDVALMREGLRDHKVDAVMLPARTSIVGDTPYMPVLVELLALDGVMQLACYARMLGYCLLAHSTIPLSEVQCVLAHPVALAEAAPWLDHHLPDAQRIECSSAGQAAQMVASRADGITASLGPALAGQLHGLAAIASGIEEGPHNVTEWWVVGHRASS